MNRNTIFQRMRDAIPATPALQSGDRRKPRSVLNTLVFHFRPRSVRPETLKFTLTYGLGGMAATLAILQLGTGILLKFIYQPTVTDAYQSIVALTQEVPFGRLIRNVHYYSAHLLVITAFCHLLRVFFTGAYHPPRQLNWIVGLGLLGTVLLSNFTGYLLPWDQLAYWAVTICTGMLAYVPVIGEALQNLVRGGPELGPASLRLFYTLHTALVPAVLVFLMAFHFWRIRKAGGLVVPKAAGEGSRSLLSPVPSAPDLFVREVAVASATLAIVLMVAVFFDAPLESPANPGLSPNPTKAPWYFAGLQELLMHLHPAFAVMVIPAMLLGALLVLPFIDYPESASGIWFGSSKGRRSALWAAVAAIIGTPAWILGDELLSQTQGWLKGVSSILARGVIPTAVLLAVSAGGYLMLRRKFSATRAEAVQALFVFFVVALAAMTIFCVWLRGAEMRLTWP